MDAGPNCSRDEWIERFAGHFGQLQPSIGRERAVGLATAAFARANDIEPEAAAVVFGELLDARVPMEELASWLR